MLTMRNIEKIYRTDTIETHALADFSLHVDAGEFVSVMGPSGSGKTTFLNVAGLLDTFESGTYTLDGKDVSGLSDSEMSRIRNRAIGFIFQSFNLIPDLNVFDNVDVPLRYRGLSGSDRKQRIERSLHLVGLSSRVKHLPSQLSGGQQQGFHRPVLAATEVSRAESDRETRSSWPERSGSSDRQRRGTTIVMVTQALSAPSLAAADPVLAAACRRAMPHISLARVDACPSLDVG